MGKYLIEDVFYCNKSNVHYRVIGERYDDMNDTIYLLEVYPEFYIWEDMKHRYPDFERRESFIDRLILVGEWIRTS